MSLKQLFKEIADSLRQKTGKTETIKASNFPLEIASIKVGEGLNTADATAIPEYILEEQTAYVNGEKITGTMPNNRNITITPTITEQTIPAGYTSGGVVEGVTANIDSNIIPENIKKDVEILGVVGSLEESSGTIEITNGAYLFYNGARLELLLKLVKTFKNLTSVAYMFYKCEELGKTYELPLFDISKANGMGYMFSDCKNLIKVPAFNTSNILTIQNAFSGCESLEIVSLLDTSKVDNMVSSFENCKSLKQLPLFDTSNVLKMSYAFRNTAIEELPQFNTSKLMQANYMLADCTALTTIPLLDFGAISRIDALVNGCTALTTLGGFKNLGKNYTQKTTNYGNYKLDLSKCVNLTHDSLMNVFNNLYDLNLTYNVSNGGKLYTQSLVLPKECEALLMEEEIAIATPKGWTISFS